MSNAWLRAFPLIVVIACLVGCAPHPAQPSFPLSAPNEIPLASLRDHPGDFAGKSVTVRAWLVRAGQSADSAWLELVDVPSQPRPLVVVLAATVAPEDLQSMVGEQLEVGLQVEGAVMLPDGRAGVRGSPLQIATAIKPVGPGAEIPTELSKQLGEVARDIRSSAVEMFRDPNAIPTHLNDAGVRITFVDAGLQKPLWTKPGPLTIDRAGPAEAPSYTYRQIDHADDGGTRESVCRFRVENGALRSVRYDERLRSSAGKIVSEGQLDFLNGSAVDKISGRSFRWPKNVYAAPCLPFAMQGFPFEEKVAVNFFLWSDYDPFTTMYAILDGAKAVTVPAGTFHCFRVRMNVNTEHIVRSLELPMPQAYDMARDVAGQMRPEDTIFWYTSAPPHAFVKMEGAMGPPGTSRGIVERTRLTPEERAALAAAP